MTTDVHHLQASDSGTGGAHALRTIIPLFGVFLGGMLGILIGMVAGVHGADVPMLLYAVATGVLCFVPLCLDQGRPMQSRHVLFSTITMFFAVRFVLPVFTMYIPAVGPIDPPGMTMSNLLPRDVAHAQSIILAGLVMLIVGYSLPVGRGLSRLVPRPRSEWTYGAALSSAVILIGLGWSLYLADQFGLLPARLGSGFIGGFTDATLFGPAILTIVYIRYRSRTALLLLLVFVPMTSFVNFFTGYKRLVLTPPAMMALTWIVAERRLRALWLVLGLVALLLLYPAAQFYREVILVGNTKTLADVGRDPSPAVAALGDFVSGNKATEYFEEGLVATGRRLDGIGHAAVIIRDTPSVSPFQHGATLALIPITYVPRMLWPGKPDTTIGAWIVDTYRIRGERIESSIGPTWVGEFYLNFGFAGVVAGMFVMGTLLRLVHESLVARSPTVLAIILEVLVLYEVMLKLTGSLATVINGPIMAMIPILLAHAIIRFFGGARPFEPGPDTGDESPAEAGFHDVPPLASAHPAGGASAEPEDR